MEKKWNYEKQLPQANDYLKGFISKVDKLKNELVKFEKARCEMIHSTIN